MRSCEVFCVGLYQDGIQVCGFLKLRGNFDEVFWLEFFQGFRWARCVQIDQRKIFGSCYVQLAERVFIEKLFFIKEVELEGRFLLIWRQKIYFMRFVNNKGDWQVGDRGCFRWCVWVQMFSFYVFGRFRGFWVFCFGVFWFFKEQV